MGELTLDNLDNVFRVLADNRRRYVLYYFEETEMEVVSLTDLTDQLTEWERKRDTTDDRSRDDHRDQLRIDLHHTHLPRLADANLIEYDSRSETVRRWESNTIDRCVNAHADELDRLFAVFDLSEASL